eukprot:Hpha_TRINITY_DN15531_c4_g2::TRINITY_DN15531_c4_g2_i1::g.105455::m.105455
MDDGFISKFLALTHAREKESSDDRRRKVVLAGPFTLVVVLSVMFFAYNVVKDRRILGAFHLGLLMILLSGTIVLIGCFVVRRLPRNVAEIAICIGATGVLFVDWANASLLSTPRAWALNVLGMDGLVVIEASPYSYSYLMGSTLLMMFLTTWEDASRWGLYRIDDWSTPLDSDLQSRISCSDLPCPVGTSTAGAGLLVYVLVFVLDFHLTRKFAEGLRKKEEETRASVVLAEQIAVALARYDLAKAESYLARKASALPPGLRDALVNILDNLSDFQQYLPRLCFQIPSSDDETSSAGSRQNTGTTSLPSTRSTRSSGLAPVRMVSGNPLASIVLAPPGNDCGILFTDIEGSTELWDLFPVGMQRALSTHNSVLRSVARLHMGYECKTIGDAFMFAFGDDEHAFRAALMMQIRLCDAHWPAELYSLKRCAQVTAPGSNRKMWGGLRIRAGLQSGPVHREDNALTGRADYFGITVNVAARLESQAVGGLLCTTDRVLNNATNAVTRLDPFMKCLGVQPMKGVANAPEVIVVLPRELEARETEILKSRTERLRREQEPSRGASNENTRSKRRRQSATLLRRHLRTSRASCAHITVRSHPALSLSASQLAQQFIAAVDEAAERTWGTVVSLLGSAMLVVWGAAGRDTVQHAVQIARSAGVLWDSASHMRDCIHYGGATGPTLHGTAGGGTHSYVVAQGPAVELAQRLSAAADNLSLFSLLAATGEEPCAADDPSVRVLTRPIDVWYSLTGEIMIVHQLNAGVMTEVRSVWNAWMNDVPDSDRWVESPWTRHLTAAKAAGQSGDIARVQAEVQALCVILKEREDADAQQATLPDAQNGSWGRLQVGKGDGPISWNCPVDAVEDSVAGPMPRSVGRSLGSCRTEGTTLSAFSEVHQPGSYSQHSESDELNISPSAVAPL